MTEERGCCPKFSKEYRAFVLKRSIVDVAIGVMIATAFNNVVKSFIDDIVTPPFGLIFDGVDFSNLTIKLPNFVRRDQPPVLIRYGLFIQEMLHLLIIGLALFVLAKFIARIRRDPRQNAQRNAEQRPARPTAPEEPDEDSEEVKILRDIRDLLAAQNNITVAPTTTSPAVQPPSLINL